MFETLNPAKSDSLLSLINAYRADVRPGKIDVGVGVYRDENGATPVMAAVKLAEAQLLEVQDSKSYLGMAGSGEFNKAMVELVSGGGEGAPGGVGVRAVQTPGGTAALRVLLDLISVAAPDAKVWLSDPTWLNHAPLVTAARLQPRSYAYLDRTTNTVRFDAMMSALADTGPGDVVLLHACCHNPSGADLTQEQWEALAELMAKNGSVPLIDLAYQGFGRGLDADAFAIRCIAPRVPELLVAASCSKNFALYRERVGCALWFSADCGRLDKGFDSLLNLIRSNYSMPPDHGAALVARILGDALLRKTWQDECEQMRQRIRSVRMLLVEAFRSRSQSDDFDFIGRHAGMFSLLNLAPEQVRRLRQEHAVYMAGDSRINVAGLNMQQIDRFVDAVMAVR